MRISLLFRPFLAAVLLATAMGSLLQTHLNLAVLQAHGVAVPVTVRLHTSALDLLGFGPTMAALVATAFLVALPLALWMVRGRDALGWPLFALAGALSLLAALAVANALAPMPTLIAANRTLAGTLGLMACASAGGLLFYALLRRARKCAA
ncbi:MAG: hypothetical protein KJ884_18675 [Gammaproteobacteria bacterium]|nr:hypothetical protein [Gammaproteobacteria bacterium]MBU1492013.1 hypothetical protein [Gammaproteobacteria bacterium]MBU2065827.1 hypothetical protein [Gammaproteobacteria bacterium]MBU2140616.1 hypothetical protein [Gammaproteobacteria bacterium]MBU2215909.1 hypothetical protein [Gammaproteobacteria bacterium]